MALTDTQKTSLFQILKVPLFDSVHLLHGEGNLNQQPFESGSSVFQAKAAIDSHLADLAANYTGYETELKALLDTWDSLGTQTYTLDGGTGGIDGISYNPESERREIRDKVMVIVPFYMAHESIQGEGVENIQVSIGR